MAAVH